MSLALYDEGLRRPGSILRVRFGDGGSVPLELERWTGDLSCGDWSLIRRCLGRVLDIGCGPGRLTGALAAVGHETLGIDLAPAAVALTRGRGAPAMRCSVFDAIPCAGLWDTALLADGNIGIGGDPTRLLRRGRKLLRPGGSILVELEAERPPRGVVRARIEAQDGLAGPRIGHWFPWAEPSSSDLARCATAAGLEWSQSWRVRDEGGRHREFVRLRSVG